MLCGGQGSGGQSGELERTLDQEEDGIQGKHFNEADTNEWSVGDSFSPEIQMFGT